MTATIEPFDTAPLAHTLHLAATLVAAESHFALFELALWRCLRQRRQNYQHYLRDLQRHRSHEHDPAQEIDPEDHVTDQLLLLQQDIQKTLKARKAKPVLTVLEGWLARRINQELIRLHGALGALRLWIMEHDADCSPILPGCFTTAEALIAALQQDALA